MQNPGTPQAATADEAALLRARVAELEAALAQSSEAEDALRQSEARFRSLVEATSDWLWEVNAQGAYTYASPKIKELLGYEPHEVLGKTPFDLMPADEAGRVSSVWATCISAAQPFAGLRNLNQHKDGRLVLIETSGVPILDANGRLQGYRGIDRDITERKRAEDDLRQSLSLLRATLESTADGILVVDSEGKIAGYNERFAQIWRIPQAILDSGEDLRAVQFVLDQLKNPDAFLARVQELYTLPEAASFDVLEFIDGRTFERYSLPQRVEGRPVGRVWSFRDVTERKRAEEDRRKLEAQLQQTQKLESLGVLAGGIAHDFNNLLTAILGHASLALTDLPPDSPARDGLREIENASCRAAELCRQMLAYAGLGRFVVEPLNLSQIIQELTHLLQVSISKKAALRCDFAGHLPAIEADSSQIRQVIMNLVINASEAMGDQEGAITVSTGAMQCDEAYFFGCPLTEKPPAGTYVYLEISDTGCGMNLETQQRIYDPFFTTKFTGRGLGLAAVLGIVRAHHGAIRVASEPGKGATFRVLFPASNKKAASATPEAAIGLWRGSGAVLLVDDEEIVRSIAKQMLERCGFHVFVAADGREAIKIYKDRFREIACVLLDLTMPHMDGQETFRELRRIHEGVKVILASGYSAQEIQRRFAGQNLAGFIEKPYQMASLSAKLSEALTPRKAPGAQPA